MTCSTEASDAANATLFFGRFPSFKNTMPSVHWEFLQSIVEAEVLVRDGQTFYTQDFIDPMTSSVSVIMVSFMPQHGIVSLITITGDFGSTVQVDYRVSHFQSMENDRLASFRYSVFLGIGVAIFIAVEKTFSLINKMWAKETISMLEFVVDMCMQVGPVNIYICMYVYMFMCVCVCVCVCVHTYAYMHVHTYLHMYVYMFAYICMMCVCVCVCVCVCTHSPYIHTYIHTKYINLYIHICTLSRIHAPHTHTNKMHV